MTLVKIEQLKPGIVQLTLQRPEKRNALSVALLEELIAAIQKHAVKERALILTGEGSVFSAGLDLKEREDPKLGPLAMQRIASLFQTLVDAPCVTLAAVQGDVLAGGVGIVLACDWAVMKEDAYLAFPEVKKGIVPALVAGLLQRQVALRHARELLLFGEQASAKQALAIGVVNKLAPAAQVLTTCLAQAKLVLATQAEVVKELKRLLK